METRVELRIQGILRPRLAGLRANFCLIWALAAWSALGQELPSRPSSTAQPTEQSKALEAELVLGSWIWTTNFSDKQVCRFWRSFSVPADRRLQRASLRITADNAYHLYLDGRDLGAGANWRSLSEYELAWMLWPGDHVLAVEALNDNLEAGLIFGLQLFYADGETQLIVSDGSWRIVPNSVRHWQTRKRPGADWPAPQVVGVIGQPPWWSRPVSVIPAPMLRPVELRFWQTPWFLGILLGACAIALALSLRLAARLAFQTRAQQLLHQERARIARDIHDDLGAGLTQLTLQGELAQCELPADSQVRTQVASLCAKSRALSDVLDEIIWTVNPKRDSVQDFTSYICTYAESAFAASEIPCRLEIDPRLADAILDLPVRRNLLLAVKEALRNVLRHSAASEVFLRIQTRGEDLEVVVEDNGTGFDPSQTHGRRNGLANMRERLRLIGGTCTLASMPGLGCRVVFTVPAAGATTRPHPRWVAWLLPRHQRRAGARTSSQASSHP